MSLASLALHTAVLWETRDPDLAYDRLLAQNGVDLLKARASDNTQQTSNMRKH